ncbi:MAG: nitroreductase family protein [Dysgonomonas sp.]|nr:nitroreductase family protein [Dysgonomonas sp.]
MKLLELIESRYSVRAYLPQSVEKEKLEYILNCARLAPSAANLQPWVFYVVEKEGEVKERVRESYHRDWFKEAPVYIVVCKDTSVSWKRTATDGKDYADVDAAIAAEHICLAAAEIGLGTCWICNFDPEILSRALQLSDNVEAVAMFCLGYINEEKSKAPEKKRRPLSDSTRWI